MQNKNFQSLLTTVAAQQETMPDAELLTKELASQLKSGTARPTDELLAPEPNVLWRTFGPWLHRIEKTVTLLGRSGPLAARQQERGEQHS